MSTPRSRRSVRSRGGGDTGSGLLGTSFGVFFFLLFLLFAVQVAFDLYARSAVTAAAFDAARLVAAGGVEHDGGTALARSLGERRARAVLGRYGEGARFDWHATDDAAVVLTVRVRNPGFLPPSLRVSRSETVRTVRVRVERELSAQ